MSFQVQLLIKAALRRREFVQVGEGSNQWSNVHIDDLVELYTIILDLALSSKKSQADGYEKFFWANSSDHVWATVNAKLATILHRRGLIDTPTVKKIRLEEEPTLRISSHSSKIVSSKARALGWQPKGKPIEDDEILEEEVVLTIGAV